MHAGKAQPLGEAGAWWAVLAGLCASLAGIGLARFAYTPLIPSLVTEAWFTAAEAAYLGAANLGGYFVGALLGGALTRRCGAATALRAMMLVATASFFACAFPLSFHWYFVWRFASGLSGGVLMVLAAPTVLPHVPAARQGIASGVIFTGVGLGIAASGTLVPYLLSFGLMQAWLGFGAISLALTVLAWGGWPEDSVAPAPLLSRAPPSGLALKALYVEYGLNAVGLVPHMVFLVDFIARSPLARGIYTGAQYWVLFGLGAMVGPVLCGYVADRIGFRWALRFAFLLQAAAVGLLAASPDHVLLATSTVIVGAFVPGIVPLVLGRVHELIADEPGRRAAWSITTATFALGMAGSAYGFSFVFSRSDDYVLLFELGAAALLLALALDLAAGFLGALVAKDRR